LNGHRSSLPCEDAAVNELDGKVCVVTGGASGIGLAMATRFRQAGMRVALADIESKPLAAAVSSLGGSDDGVLGVTCDVTSPASVDALRDAVVDRFGTAHIVCLNAGVAASGSILETTLESWRWMFDVNVMGVVHGINSFAPLLVAQGEGHIVCTASAAGLVTPPGLGGYAATKHAVVGLSAVLREELASAGVGVSVVCPGVVRTRIFESERNRPQEFRGPTHTDDATAKVFLEATAGAPGPEIVADAVYEGVLADTLFVLPSPEVNGMVLKRLEQVRAALPPS
jgi:NAD(P)-dependent dehydrogenase (short-subunit alcohol dehydrogenase family)